MTQEEPASAADALNPLQVVMRYHQETKHHFSRYARAPGTMDWANQPDPFASLSLPHTQGSRGRLCSAVRAA